MNKKQIAFILVFISVLIFFIGLLFPDGYNLLMHLRVNAVLLLYAFIVFLALLCLDFLDDE